MHLPTLVSKHRNRILTAVTVALILGLAYAAGQALAAERATPSKEGAATGHIARRLGADQKPIKAPAALLRARQACPNTASIVQCRSALIRSINATTWQKAQNIRLAREMLGKLTDWTCIHHGEAAWNANTGNGYHGGLQMDWPFMRTYGRDMLQRHHGRGAEAWTPREQIIVAQRAYAQNRGYNPWPNTSRACGLR